MNIKGKMMMLFGAMVCVMSASSCSDSKSYAEQLADERVATNLFLSQQRVVNEIPADTIFETISGSEPKALFPTHHTTDSMKTAMCICK